MYTHIRLWVDCNELKPVQTGDALLGKAADLQKKYAKRIAEAVGEIIGEEVWEDKELKITVSFHATDDTGTFGSWEDKAQ